MDSHQAYIGIGSNLGDRIQNCKLAVKSISSVPKISLIKQSSWIETDPVGYLDQNRFINGAVLIETSLSPTDLLNELQKIENKMGRVRTIPMGPRTIDLDLLLYDDLQIKTETLTIPHPRMKERDFVQIPLLEIAPSLASYFVIEKTR